MSDAININLTIAELNLVLEALGNIPYYRVYELINKLQSQGQAQLNKLENMADKKNGELQPAAKKAAAMNAMEA